MNPVRNALRLAALYAIAAASLAHAVSAHAGNHAYVVDNAAYRQECGSSCHIPYPPALLDAASWRAVMGGLDKHFGTDASLDPATRANVLAFLEDHSSRRFASFAGRPMLRITDSPRFQKEHLEELPADIVKRPDVKSWANCGACHRGAEAGDYNKAGRQVPGRWFR